MTKFNIHKPDDKLRQAIIDKIDNPNKPTGSLGRLEGLALQICLIEQTLHPTLHNPYHLLFGGPSFCFRVIWQNVKLYL